MKPFPVTPEFMKAARSIIWFEPPEQSLQQPIRLLAYAMNASVDEDMALLVAHVGQEGLIETLDNAPPGIICPRSWSYWNAKVGRFPAPPMPKRMFGERG
jgi:hypothetical protein